MLDPSHEHAATHGVTMVVTRTARPGREADYEAWLTRAIAAVRAFPGHLGVDVVRTPPRTYVVLFRYATVDQLLAWEASPERAALLVEADALTEGAPIMRKVTGMETWFAVPNARSMTPPPRWKMVAVTWSVAFPTLQILNATVGTTLAPLPALLRGAIVGLSLVLFMTYVGMPLATRTLANWLFPPQSS